MGLLATSDTSRADLRAGLGSLFPEGVTAMEYSRKSLKKSPSSRLRAKRGG